MSSCIKAFLGALLCSLFTLPAFAKNTILVVGDSLSAGYGINPKESWVALLQNRLDNKNHNYKVVNASISGDTTSNGLARLPQALRQHKPSITIIELGANDGLRGLQITNIKTNIERMIVLAKQANSKVLLLGMRIPLNYGPIYREHFEKIFIDVAKQQDVSVVPNFLTNVDEDIKLFQPDGLHPASQAQNLILNNIWPVLEKLL